MTEYSKYASRKWQITVFILLATLALFGFTEKLSEAGFVDLTKWVVGLYFGFNVAQKGLEWLAPNLMPTEEKS